MPQSSTSSKSDHQPAPQQEGRSYTGGWSVPSRPWSIPAEDILAKLKTDPGSGLRDRDVSSRLDEYGENALRKKKEKSILSIFLDQFRSFIIALLAAAAVVSLWFGEVLDFWAIIIVILISTLIGFFTELRAVRSMEALYRMGRVRTRVIRNGSVREEDAAGLVPGDIVTIEGGDVITADLRILKSSMLLADESSLTGESNPVEKKETVLDKDTVLAERENMLYKGTSVTQGSALAVVTSTGMHTELGTITELVHEAEEEQTPLEERLDKLGNRLILVTLVITIIIVLTGLATGRDLLLLIQTGVALAVATIPEGLPIVATIALAKGIREMAARNALITKLSSVETLGSTQVIFTDKTGTLTENRMTVTHYLLPSAENGHREIRFESGRLSPADASQNGNLRAALETGVLCNNAALSEKGEDGPVGTGDPLEIALLAGAEDLSVDPEELQSEWERVKEAAFNPEQKMMAVWNRIPDDSAGGLRVSVKGAPGPVLDVCNRILLDRSGQKSADHETHPFENSEIEEWKRLNRKLAASGLRILALAYKDEEGPEPGDDPYNGLIFIGLVALLDPPRTDVKESIETCKRAGVRVVMVTGDQIETARYIAKETGLETDHGKAAVHGAELEKSLKDDELLTEASVFARVSPKQKLDLIDRFQEKGVIVAMTGDGVNDAPALKSADIGIAMGQRGSQVAREASDMVLTDDAFSSIVAAIEQGRVIFNNIRNFIFYLMSCNISEVMVVAVSFITGMPLPVLPLQILFLNLVTDVFPALALGVSKGEKDLMLKPPRNPDEAILTRTHWILIVMYGVVITFSVLTVLWIALNYLGLPARQAATLSFLTLALSQLWHVFNMHSSESGFFNNTIMQNPFVWGAILLSAALLLIALYVPAFAAALSLFPPSAAGWAIVLGFSLIPLVIGQISLMIHGKRESRKG
jgi:Ca2+-transporting ATPase